MDPKVNGQIQQEWGWLVAMYLFLGGVGSGAYTIGALNGFIGGAMEPSTAVGLWISFPAVLIGTIFLLLDLGTPMKAILAGVKTGTSWIARGFWIISIFMIIAFVHTVILFYTDMGGPDASGGIITVLSLAGIAFAVATMAYTGILVSAAKGIPFWRSGVVPVVFVISAIVTGHFAIIIGLVLFGDSATTAGQLQIMSLEAAVLVAVEVLAILFFLQAAFKVPDSRESAERILKKRSFVVGYVILGLVAPLLLMLLLAFGMTESSVGASLAVAFLGSALGLVGGLMLRYAVLVCGALPTMNIAGFKFRRIAREKEPKPEIGLMPPQ